MFAIRSILTKHLTHRNCFAFKKEGGEKTQLCLAKVICVKNTNGKIFDQKRCSGIVPIEEI